MSQTDPNDTATPASPHIIRLAMKRFNLAAEAEANIRKLALEDLKFRAGEQWPANIQQARDIEMKPCLTINRIPQFVRQVTNDERQNRPALHFIPVEDSDEDVAEVYEGMAREIQARSDADIAYDTACDNQVTMGFGYFRVVTEYCDEMSFDQDIKIKRIKNPFTVYFDPSCIEPDYSDAKWCFIVSDVQKEEFKNDYPEAKSSDIELSSVGDDQAGWMGNDFIRVAEYFRIEEKETNIFLLIDGRVVTEEQFKTLGLGDAVIKAKRATQIRKVLWSKITAFEELSEPQEWAGKYIPIVPVLGEDLDIDGERQLIGMVRYVKDPQRMYNYWSTAQTEAIALAPKAPFILAAGQETGFETFWKQANLRSYPYLPYNPIDIEGTPLPPPQRQQAEPPVQAMVQAIAQASDDMKATTGIYDAGLGSRSNETSGKAITARQQEGDTSNFHYIDNLARSIRFLGRILADLIPKIYDAPRIVRTLGEDGSSKMVKVNQPSGEKDASGVEKIYDLKAGKYDVQVQVGPSYTTKRQQASESMVQITQGYPDIFKVAGDIMVKNMDWPGAQQVAERLKKMLPPNLQEDDPNADVPPAIQAKMQEMTGIIEQLTNSLNEKHSESEGKTLELESKERIAYANNETKLILEAFKSEGEASRALLAAELQQISTRLGMLGTNVPIPDTTGGETPAPGMPPGAMGAPPGAPPMGAPPAA